MVLLSWESVWLTNQEHGFNTRGDEKKYCGIFQGWPIIKDNRARLFIPCVNSPKGLRRLALTHLLAKRGRKLAKDLKGNFFVLLV